MREEYDWQAEEDARTLRRYQEIKSDPNRFNKAKQCVASTVKEGIAVLKDQPLIKNKSCRNSNKATIGKLTPKY